MTTPGLHEDVRIGSAVEEPSDAELIARAVALRAELIAHQAEAEQLTHYSEDMHQKFLDARFYDMFVPRMYGGLEREPKVFFEVVKELARGDMGSAWCFCLAANHALHVASWYPQEVQDRVFGNHDFRAASVSAPTVRARRTADGYVLNGRVDYCSGIPWSTYYLGQCMVEQEDGGEPRMAMFLAPRDSFKLLGNWGDTLGLRATGSESIQFEEAPLPAEFVQEDTDMINMNVAGGTVGSALHGNPMYAGRGLVTFTISLAVLAVGGGLNALDDYEELMRRRKTPLPPLTLRIDDPDYQRHYGAAYTKLKAAEATLKGVIETHTEYCRATVDGTREYTFQDDWSLACVVREVILQVWEAVEEHLFRTVGSGSMRSGERFERLFRDLATLVAHRNPMLREQAFRNTAQLVLGIEPAGQ